MIEKVREKLISNIDEETKDSSQRYFKEKINSYGIKIPVINQISKEFFADIKELDKSEIFNLCEQLWQSGNLEESFIACNWSYYMKKSYEKKDFYTFLSWVKNYVNNWASCDTLCNHNIGDLIIMYPELIDELLKITASENRWMRRAAAVSLIVPAKKGMFLDSVFKIADELLFDTDDLVRKGYGWMLKVSSIKHQKEVYDYVIKNKKQMPRTSLRYAIEKMPKEMKAEAMKK